MKIGFARFENDNLYATVNPAEETLQGYAADLASNNPGKEVAQDFFAETPPEGDVALVIATIDKLVEVSPNFQEGLEWLLGSIYTLGVARGEQKVIADWDARCGLLAESIAKKLEAMDFHSQQSA